MASTLRPENLPATQDGGMAYAWRPQDLVVTREAGMAYAWRPQDLVVIREAGMACAWRPQDLVVTREAGMACAWRPQDLVVTRDGGKGPPGGRKAAYATEWWEGWIRLPTGEPTCDLGRQEWRRHPKGLPSAQDGWRAAL